MAARSNSPAKNEPSPERKKREMKKTTLKTRLWALAATLLLLVSLLALPVSAANTNVAAPGGEFTFKKYLVMDANANVPNVTFEFTIDAGTAVAATGSSPAIYAGIVEKTGGTVTKPTVTNATFSYNIDKGSTTDGLPTDTTTTPNMKYATKEVTVDFSGISFTAPGIYRYTITEVAPAQSGIAIQGSGTRTLDVYVEYTDDSATTLAVKHYVLQDGTANPNTATKSKGFTNTYTTYDLTLTKTVTGNQGDRDKYFAFTVNITDAVEGTVYTVDLPDTDSYASNPETLTVGNQGSVTATYYLKHDQSIVIQGLTTDTKYVITETDYSGDGYSTAYSLDSANPVTAIATPSENNTMNGDDHTVTFTNDKQGTVPTGILLETAPYLILGAVVVVGLVVLFATRRRRTRE